MQNGAWTLSGRMPHSQSCEPGFEYLASIDGGGNVSDLVVARNCCMARMLPREAELVSE